jgi:hypothetical protein
LAGHQWRRWLRRVDDTAVHVPTELIDLLRANPIFRPLPPPVVEHLASMLIPRTAEAGATIFRQGDPGDLFYIVESGRCEISIDGAKVAEAVPGEGFGEIALLRDVSRTATVTAVDETNLLALECDVIAAVTGHAPSREAADARPHSVHSAQRGLRIRAQLLRMQAVRAARETGPHGDSRAVANASGRGRARGSVVADEPQSDIRSPTWRTAPRRARCPSHICLTVRKKPASLVGTAGFEATISSAFQTRRSTGLSYVP